MCSAVSLLRLLGVLTIEVALELGEFILRALHIFELLGESAAKRLLPLIVSGKAVWRLRLPPAHIEAEVDA